MNNGSESRPPKAPVVGTPISVTTYEEVLGHLDDRPGDRALVVAVCTVHSVMSARRDPELASALRAADIATPDGMPLAWALRAAVNPLQPRVYGPDLLRLALVHGIERGWKHYFYGSTRATLDRLVTAIERETPGSAVVGALSPPFRQLSAEEEDAHAAEIRDSDADLVWVGLGMPKQELWMHRMRERLPGTALIGVGAAFDFLAGTVRQAPKWMQDAGLEWAFRLSQEPRRLWRRYLWNNPAYLGLLAGQLLRSRWDKRRTGDRPFPVSWD